MIFLLDTSAFSALMRRDASMSTRLAGLAEADRVVVSVITRGEILYGLSRLPQGRRRRGLEVEAERLFAQLVCQALTEAAADSYADIKRRAERAGTPLDENDLWIAAAALSMGATLVTADTDFRRVRGLRVEDWARQ